MPPIWLNILLDENVSDKSGTLIKLKYDYTVDDVYDLLEFLDVQQTVLRIQERSKEQEQNYANR